MVRTVKRQATDIPVHRDEDVSYNPMRYSSSSANITLDPQLPESYLPLQSLSKHMKDMSVASSIDGFSQVSLPSLTKSQSQALPVPSPKAPREHVIESQTGGDSTITIPKIEYSHDDFGSEDEEEDSEAVAKVERKYYRK